MRSKIQLLRIDALVRAVAVAALLFCFCRGATVLAEDLASGLRVEPAEVDFGQAAQQQVREAKVKLTNTGKESVSIFSVTTDCDCTTASVEKASLAAGEISTLTIKLETRTQTGNVRRMVIVHATSGDLAVPVKLVVSPSQTPATPNP